MGRAIVAMTLGLAGPGLLACSTLDLSAYTGGAAPEGSAVDAADGSIAEAGAGEVGVVDAGMDGMDADGGCDGALDCERRVFVTRAVFQGDLGGIVGAETKCNAAAAASSLPNVKGRRFLPWVSTSGSAVEDRFPHGTRPYLRTDGKIVGSSFADLVDGILDHAIGTDERGEPVTDHVWTGSYPNGQATPQTCEAWTTKSGAGDGTVGSAAATSGEFALQATVGCDEGAHLYCVEY